MVDQRIELCDEQHFRRRIVYSFITGDFVTLQLERFVAVLAALTGTGPLASAYFRHHGVSVEVQSGSISLAGNAGLLPVLREMTRLFSDAKYLDAHMYASAKLSWMQSLQELHAWPVSWRVLPLMNRLLAAALGCTNSSYCFHCV